MATLWIYCAQHQVIEDSVEVQDATTMGYAALHAAEAMGQDPSAGEYFLLTVGKAHIHPGDLAVDWHETPVILSRR